MSDTLTEDIAKPDAEAAAPQTAGAPLRFLSAGQVHPFVENPHEIKTWPGTTQKPQKTEANTLSYTISLKTVSGVRVPYFSEKSYDPHPETDVDFDLRIRVKPPATSPGGYFVDLVLDPAWDWHFPAADSVMLGDATDVPGDHYYDLRSDAPYTTATFYAFYYDFPDRQESDPYNLNFVVNIEDENGNVVPLAVSVDPDIKNPGDPP